MCLFFTTLTLWWGLLNRHFSIFFFLTKKRESAYRPADNLSCVRISRFCKALMSLHLRGAFLCEGRGFSITLGYFINRTAGARFPDLLPPPAVWVCVHMVCVGECVYVYEHGETKWQTARALGKLTDLAKLLVTLVNQKPADCCLSHFFSWKSCLFPVGYWRQRVCFSWGFFLFVFFSSEKRPSRLTAPFILYYPAWLLTPGELCSQIDALLLWGCSWNIKLY